MENLLPAAGAFLGGLLAAFLNFIITQKAISSGEKARFLLPLRVLVAAVFIALLYFVGTALKLNLVVFMIAGALGITLGLIFFTMLLVAGKSRGGED